MNIFINLCHFLLLFYAIHTHEPIPLTTTFGKPHQQRPDKDNLEKAILDAIFKQDSHIWDGRTSKIWGNTGSIIIKEYPVDIEEIKSLLVEES